MKKTNRLRRRRRITLAGISTGGILAMAGGAAAAPANTNLVVNGGFENVNLQSTGGYNGPQILNWSGTAAFAYSHDGSSSSAGVVLPPPPNVIGCNPEEAESRLRRSISGPKLDVNGFTP